ncbi:deoxyribose-phosphate aldolase, partial [Vibrio parahaemolyticus]|uniref:deoxyribose-phosphate aldolase n=1 Tax=Vibrio parahaemolyticus TaxID=670 RepID=UPI00146A67A3
SAIKDACGQTLLKVIFETCLLTNEQIVELCHICKRAGADYVKTSTGFSTGGATVEHITSMRDTVGKQMGVKASGGVRTKETAQAMIDAGASRVGASASVSIVTGEAPTTNGY